MRLRLLVIGVLTCALAAPARAEVLEVPAPPAGNQVQADLGLSVAGPAFELSLAPRWAVAVGAQIYGTYFAPWFDAGDDFVGFGGQVRLTWFARASHHGLYVAGFARGNRVRAKLDDAIGFGGSVGGFVGWAWSLGAHLDLRAGVGAQYFHDEAGAARFDSLFPGIDLVVGWRL
jgi:hypothetical protein